MSRRWESALPSPSKASGNRGYPLVAHQYPSPTTPLTGGTLK